ncbi:MAG: tyrosine-protein kinase family protein [Bacteroidota bacterium]
MDTIESQDQKSSIDNPQKVNTGHALIPKNNSLVEVQRSIVVSAKPGEFVDPEIVKFEYYNSFNYALLSDTKTNVKLNLGITSANSGEGKTLTASNLAVSLTMGYRKRTVLVDMNFRSPKLHKIFGAAQGPGLIDALHGEAINLTATSLDNLYLLTAGISSPLKKNGKTAKLQTPIGVEHTNAFGEILAALGQEFDFVIVDMPAIITREFPILFVNHLNGLLVVVEMGKTKRQDIDKIFRHVNKNQVLGFVFNRFSENEG